MRNSRRSKAGKEIERDQYLCKKLGEELYKAHGKEDFGRELTIKARNGKTYKLTDITP